MQDNRMPRIVLAAVVGAVVSVCCLAPGCGERAGAPSSSRARVVVTLPPLAGLVRGLVGPDADVVTLIAPGASPHGFELTPSQVADLARADLVFYAGLGLEPQVERFLEAHPSGQRVDLSMADAVGIAGPTGGQESRDPADDGHDHGGVDPHLWLDPVLVARLVDPLRDAVGRATDLSTETLQTRSAALSAKIAAIDAAYRDELAPFGGRAVVTHHAAWHRVLERYGLEVAAVLRQSPDAEPTPAAIAAAVRAGGVAAVFVEPQFDPTEARRIAEATGAALGTLDPLGDGDWFALMRRNLDSLVIALGG